MTAEEYTVIPAKAGIQKFPAQNNIPKAKKSWITAQAGMRGVPIIPKLPAHW